MALGKAGQGLDKADCLSEDALTGLLEGGLASAEQEERWHAHIEGCAACYELFRALAAPSERAGHFASSGHSALRLDSASVPAPRDEDGARAPAFTGTPRFALLRHLGTGGMGRVYEVLDRDRGARVALKLLRRVSPGTIAHLKREFRALQDLSHPSLVTHLELVSDADRWFLTMELVEGRDLLSYLRAGDREPRLRSCLLQLAQALSFLHRAGMLHCDIKPANVLVRPDGHVVLVDLSLTTAISAQEHRAAGFGTLPYAAPEQLAAGPLGPAADWYSVGALLYEALCGQRPFRGSPAEILRRKQEQEPPPPSSLAPDVPPDLDALCAALLRRRPEDRPGADEVLRILAPAGALPSSPLDTAEPPASPPFVGRAAELQALRAALALRGPGPVCVLLEGESGVGKSALLRRFAEEVRASEPDALVLATRCYEREAVPYKAVDGAMDALARHLLSLTESARRALLPEGAALLARVFPAFAGLPETPPEAAAPALDPLELRSRVFSVLRLLLERLARPMPLVLLLDDLQWTDGDSVALLRELLRPPRAPALLLVAARRPLSHQTPGPDAIRALAPEAPLLTLQPLPSAEARALTRLLLPAQTDAAAVDSLAEESAGHPLFIQELVRHSAGHIVGHTAPALPRLQDAIRTRVAALAPDAAHLLSLISLAGLPLPQDSAAAAAQFAPELFLKHLAQLRASRLIRSTGTGGADLLEPYHDRIREAVVEPLPPARRATCYLALAQALEAQGSASAEALAGHFYGAGDLPRAARYAAQAAAEADRALAFDRAARLYRLALDLGAEDRPQLLLRLAQALANSGRSRDAGEAYVAAAADLSAADALPHLHRAAEEFLHHGHIDAGQRTLAAVLKGSGVRMPAGPRSALLSVLWNRAWLRLRGTRFRQRARDEVPAHLRLRLDAYWVVGTALSMVDPMVSMALMSRHNLLALQAGDVLHVERALCLEAILAAMSGDRTERSWRLLATAEAAVSPEENRREALLPLPSSAAVLLWEGRWQEALDRGAQAEAYLRQRIAGSAWEIENMKHLQVLALGFLGETAELARRVPALLHRASQRGDLYMAVCLRIGGASLAWLAPDDPEGARRAVRSAMAEWGQRAFHLEYFLALVSEGEIDLYEGEGQAAHKRVREAASAIRKSLLTQVQVWRIVATDLRARCAIAAAQGAGRAALLAEARRDTRRLAGERRPFALALAQRLQAACAVATGDRGGALSLLDQAAQGFDSADMALHAAAARFRRGQLLGGEEGRALTATAEAWMSAQGVRAPARMTAMLMPGRFSPQPPEQHAPAPTPPGRSAQPVSP